MKRKEVVQAPNGQPPQPERREQKRQGPPPRPANQAPKFPEGHAEPMIEELNEEVKVGNGHPGQPAAAPASASVPAINDDQQEQDVPTQEEKAIELGSLI